MFQGMATGHPALATIHANTLQRLMDRLTTPPVSLSPSLLENLDVVVFLARTKTEGKFVRRVNKVYEVAGVNVREVKIIPNKVFEWDPVKDQINMAGKSLIIKKIADFKGIDYETAFKELQRRALFLEWLSMNKVTNYLEFEKWVRSYYYDTEKVMKMVIDDVRRRAKKGDKVVPEKLRVLGE
jgi:flagellar protein FlaI